MNDKLTSIFQDAPDVWGLRGDPFLWYALERHLAKENVCPESAADLKIRLDALYEKIVGAPASSTKPVLVESFKQAVGISSGMISPTFWQEVGIPLLLNRYEKLTRQP